MALSPGLVRKPSALGQYGLPTVAAGGMGGGGQPSSSPASAPEMPRKGFDWRKLLGVVGDSFSIVGGGQPSYVPMMQRRQIMDEACAYAEGQAERDRVQDLQDWVAKQRWQRENPAPVNNDTVADYNFWKQTLPPDQFNKWLQNRIDPPQYRQGPDGNFYRINTSPAPSITEEEWNKGTPVTGGPTPSASGGFP